MARCSGLVLNNAHASRWQTRRTRGVNCVDPFVGSACHASRAPVYVGVAHGDRTTFTPRIHTTSASELAIGARVKDVNNRTEPGFLRTKRLLCDVPLELCVECRASVAPDGAHLLLGFHMEIAGRDQGFRSLDLDEHHCFNRVLRSFLAVYPLRRFEENIVAPVQLGASEKPVTAPRQLLDHVDLYEWIALQIRARSRRKNVQKKNV